MIRSDDVVARMLQAYNNDDLDAVVADAAEDVVYAVGSRGLRLVGRDAWRTVLGTVAAAVPGRRLEVTRQVVTEEAAVLEWTFSGVSSGQVPGYPPAGEPVSMDGCSVIALRDGQIVSFRDYLDRVTLQGRRSRNVDGERQGAAELTGRVLGGELPSALTRTDDTTGPPAAAGAGAAPPCSLWEWSTMCGLSSTLGPAVARIAPANASLYCTPGPPAPRIVSPSRACTESCQRVPRKASATVMIPPPVSRSVPDGRP